MGMWASSSFSPTGPSLLEEAAFFVYTETVRYSRIIPEHIKYIIGIDEAGRGPLAGPVAVGAVCVPVAFLGFRKFARGVRDSKKLTAEKREEWFRKLEKTRDDGMLSFSVFMSSAEMINEHGIVPAITFALHSAIAELPCIAEETLVLLDGGLRAPKQFLFQETIIGGDDKEPTIALGSIAAKVTRDRFMIELAKGYPEYGFERHKGYGTKAHFSALKEHGILDGVHRIAYVHEQRLDK